MKNGEFTGPEMFLLEKNAAAPRENPLAYGIESRDVYRRDLELFRRVIRSRHVTAPFTEACDRAYAVLQSRVFSPIYGISPRNGGDFRRKPAI
jgi:hypothetical protein